MTDSAKRKIILFMLKKDLLDMDVDFLQNQDILGWAGYMAGRYIASGIISGHLTRSNVMDHLIEVAGVHQTKSNIMMFKDTIRRNILCGMATPATTEMVDNLITGYNQERERIAKKAEKPKPTFSFAAALHHSSSPS